MVPRLLLLLSFGAFLVWGFAYASTDLWWDEITSLEGYALVDFRTIVTGYDQPNNHVLFNVLHRLWLQLLGVADLFGAIDHVGLLRWGQWIVAAGTVAFVARSGWRIFGPMGGALSAVFLVSTLPFLNFSMQLRGYGLGVFFAAGLLDACLHISGGLQTASGSPDRWGWKKAVRSSVAVTICTFGLLYSVPSNVYSAVSVGLWAVAVLALSRIRGGHTATDVENARRQGREGWILLGLGLGTVAAFLAYLPILDAVFHNRFVSVHPPDRFFVLATRLPGVLGHLLSFRYLLVVLIAFGFVWHLMRGSAAGDPSSSARASRLAVRHDVLLLLMALLIPFVLSFLRNDWPFERTFLVVTPAFALLLGGGTASAARIFSSPGSRGHALSMLAVAFYALGTATWGYLHVQGRLDREFRETLAGEQNLLGNSYQSRSFRPSEGAAWLGPKVAAAPGPVLFVHEADRVAWSSYLAREGVPSLGMVRLIPAEPEARAAGMTHLAQLQVTKPGEEHAFYGVQLSLPSLAADDALTPILEAAQRFGAVETFYVVTDFPSWTTNLAREIPAGWTAMPLRETGGFGTIWELRPPG